MDIDFNKLSYKDLIEIKRKIAEIENTRCRTYEVSFKISFKAIRNDDLEEPESFADHVSDAFRHFELHLPEQVSDVVVREI